MERGSSVGRTPDSQSREPGFESPVLPFRSLGIEDEYPKSLRNLIRMDRSSFCDLLDKVSQLISKETSLCVRRLLNGVM